MMCFENRVRIYGSPAPGPDLKMQVNWTSGCIPGIPRVADDLAGRDMHSGNDPLPDGREMSVVIVVPVAPLESDTYATQTGIPGVGPKNDAADHSDQRRVPFAHDVCAFVRASARARRSERVDVAVPPLHREDPGVLDR